MILLGVELAILFAAAALLVRAATPQAPAGGSAFAIAATLALGLGLCGLSQLVWLLFSAPILELRWLTDLPFLLVAVIVWRRHQRAAVAVPGAVAPEPSPRSLVAVILGVLTAAVLAAAVVAMLVSLRAQPHGQWDAYAIWNLRARFLFRGAEHWTSVFHPENTHNDYPLLLPLIVARGWTLVGHDTTAVPRVVAFLGAGLVLSFQLVTLHRLRGTIPACLAVLATLSLPSGGGSLPMLLDLASSQFADSLLACFILASLCSLALSLVQPEASAPSLVLAGAFAGLAAWTKNEGRLFAAALLIVLVLVTFWRRGRRCARRRGGELLAGVLPPAIFLWIVNATFVRTPADFFNQPKAAIVEKVLSGSRHLQILTLVLDFLTRRPYLPLFLLLAIYAFASGLTAHRRVREAAAILGSALGFVALGYYAVYLISPYDLDWHLRYSLDRLFIHLWPSLVLCVFLASRTPAETMR